MTERDLFVYFRWQRVATNKQQNKSVKHQVEKATVKGRRVRYDTKM